MFLLNAALLVVAGVLLALSPVTISAPVKVLEEVALGVGILVLLVANYVMLRPAFKPLERLAERMRNVDLLRPGRRLTPAGSPEVVDLVLSFNEMLERLELERRESGRRALAAQETERKRIATELHDEVGQSMTGVLLLLQRVAGEVPRPGVKCSRRRKRRPARASRRCGGSRRSFDGAAGAPRAGQRAEVARDTLHRAGRPTARVGLCRRAAEART